MYAQGSGKLETLSPIVSPTVFSTSHPPRTLEPCLSLCLPLCHLIFKLVSQLVFHLSPSLMSPTLFPSLSPTMSPTVSPILSPAVSSTLPPTCLPGRRTWSPNRLPVVSQMWSPICLPIVTLSSTCPPQCPVVSQRWPPNNSQLVSACFHVRSSNCLPIVSPSLSFAFEIVTTVGLQSCVNCNVRSGCMVSNTAASQLNYLTHTHNAACEVVQSDGWTWDGCTRINECINMYQSMSMETHLASGLQT